LATFSNLAWSPKAPTKVGIEIKDLNNFMTLLRTAPAGKSLFKPVFIGFLRYDTSSKGINPAIFLPSIFYIQNGNTLL